VLELEELESQVLELELVVHRLESDESEHELDESVELEQLEEELILKGITIFLAFLSC
jgi:hypothetical protein